jgi:UDP-N-acetylglucosamine 2-epimerase (non-hydrolysing)|tara:strand:- start:206 stop:1300 length:1095 start_codon:yes stop_codon:yes gene_type:complete
MIVHLITGTRPNVVKAAPVYKELSKLVNINLSLVHTGQHYDPNMKDVFFKDLRLFGPDIHLNAKGSTHASQTASIMCEYEDYAKNEIPDIIVVFGDVDSTLACSLVASKLQIPIAHVESGLRSFDRSMPEEINRVLTDQLSQYLFTTSPEAEGNLLKEGKSKEQIFFVGNTMIDSLEVLKNQFDKSKIIENLNITLPFALMTFHRPSNVDSPENLNLLVDSIIKLSKLIVCVFPVHPRTKKLLKRFSLIENLENENNLIITNPLGYIDFMSIQKRASVVITDSGGIQEESTYFGVPCLTVRNSTERPITVNQGTNKIIGTSYKNIIHEVELILSNTFKRKGIIPELWDGHASNRINDIFRSIII